MKYIALFENFKDDAKNAIGDFVRTSYKMMIVSGVSGSGKVYITKEALKEAGLVEGKDFFFVDKLSDAEDLEMILNQKEYAGKMIVIDDSDALMDDSSALNILKGLADGGHASIEDIHGNREIKLEGDAKLILIVKQAPDALTTRCLHIKI